MSSASVTTPARRHSGAKKTETPMAPMIQAHQNQFPEMPRLPTIPAMTSGVSEAHVVATMLVPIHHQGRLRSATKYDARLLDAAREVHTPTISAKTR